MRKSFIYIIGIIFAILGCSESYIPVADPQIVVEGWIESDGFPVVIVTSTVPVAEEYMDYDSLSNYIIRWAKVSVSDGTDEVVLTGKLNNDYFPPYIYTSSRMVGEPGKRYTLKVEYSGRVVTAETTIPKPVPLDWLKVKPLSNGKVSIVAGLKDDRTSKDQYKFFTKRMRKDSIYTSSFMGLIDDSVLSDGINEIEVKGKVSSEFGTSENNVYYSDDDLVLIRFCTLDQKSFEYWEDYEDIQTLSNNSFFPVNRKIRSNVSSGYGYWAGYGSTYYRVSIPDSLNVVNK